MTGAGKATTRNKDKKEPPRYIAERRGRMVELFAKMESEGIGVQEVSERSERAFWKTRQAYSR